MSRSKQPPKKSPKTPPKKPPAKSNSNFLQAMWQKLFGKPEEDPSVTCGQRLKHFFVAHWRGLVIIIVPLAALYLVLPLPGKPYAWCGYTLIVMAFYWVTECIPLPVTSFLPMVVFPLANVMTSAVTAKCYFNDTILMFLGTMILAASVEQCGLHNRLALCTVRAIGYSHYKTSKETVQSCYFATVHSNLTYGAELWAGAANADRVFVMQKRAIHAMVGAPFDDQCRPHFKELGILPMPCELLLGMCIVTTFVSLWVSNTGATIMVVPIIWALLKIFEDEGILQIFEVREDGSKYASNITTCYFCCAAFSSTIGGIGTLTATGTNLVFRGLFQDECPEAIDYLSFAYFSAYAIPYMIVMESFIYMWFIFYYFGFLRPHSDAAKSAYISPAGMVAAKKAVDEKWKALGPMKCWEYAVAVLFMFSMALLFSRSPVIFTGWADHIMKYYNKTKHYIKDSVCSAIVVFLMAFLPNSCIIWKHCTAKFTEDLPVKPIRGILDWTLMNAKMPFSFMFLLGGGFCLAKAANKSNTDLNGRIGDVLKMLEALPNPAIVFILIVFTVFVTNFASNMATVNVIGPISMTMAKSVKQNPLQYIIITGFCASFSFLLPVGTAPNLIVQMSAKIPTMKMVCAGVMPSVTSILVTYAAVMLWAPVIWPDVKDPTPKWCTDAPVATEAPTSI